jgi:glyoxalase/bleomycin resistance protein/dioxygenase superfamily protein
MLRLADFAVSVTDAKKTAQWWEERVGFKTHTVGPPGGHAIMVAPPGERFLIHLCEGFESVEPGNTGIAFVTDEIEKQVRLMEAAKVEFPEPLRLQSWGGSAKFADPDGNVFWLLGASTSFIRGETSRRAGAPTQPKKRSRRGGRGPTGKR